MDVSTKAIMDTSGERRRNKRWPEALKREIVAATLKPGASVSVAAGSVGTVADRSAISAAVGRAAPVRRVPVLPSGWAQAWHRLWLLPGRSGARLGA